MSSGPFLLRQRAMNGGRAFAMELRNRDEAMTWGDALRLWRQDETFVAAFTDALKKAPFDGFLWETPPVSARTLTRPFEWVVVRNDVLARAEADDLPFAEHIRGAQGIQTFDSLGGDARLIVPCAETAPQAYPHLAAFVRQAPAHQVHALWEAVAQTVESCLDESPAPRWVSTSGLGVYWVHVRVDERPKYYAHSPYREEP